MRPLESAFAGSQCLAGAGLYTDLLFIPLRPLLGIGEKGLFFGADPDAVGSFE